MAAAPQLGAHQLTPGEPVSLYLTVEQGDKLVRGLGPQNFRLREDGEAVPFRLEQPETPVSIALLVEDSRAAGYYYWDDLRAALDGFLSNAPAGNWYALGSFANELEINQDFTQEIPKLRNAFAALGYGAWNESNTYDAVYEMLDKLGRLPGRKALIFIGSGIDTFSGRTLDDVQKKAEQVNVTVYAVALGSLFRGRLDPYLGTEARMDLLQARAFLQMLADKTGGEAWFPNLEGAYPDVMKGIFQSLESQYRLVYFPNLPRDGEFHKIEVEAFVIADDERKDFKVRVREGWRQ
ncbi:MAG TPA: VWA domain-containing protein [Bryobacteraceae bacterium]|nr:VWA domain-containing protein [Bryobacteraceae bacterium]HOQ44180.1 VWA domain-containing protein [Bryobacteraceae bacterium]HPQ13792.1 VWA domain-containing protein [Bryobacteraceae bacterium]HPU70498.1 VWA domain-containing protein [Bryobacteraceae bacterium]